MRGEKVMTVAEKTAQTQHSIADEQACPSPPPMVKEYRGDAQRIIRRMNELRSTELCSYLQYKQHAYMVVSLLGIGAREEFLEHADEELKHADMLAERIQQLGGVPIFDPAEIARMADKAHVNVTQGATVEQMVRADLEVEITQVNAYMAFIREVGFDDPTSRRILEDILKDTENHANELREMLSRRAETRG
jgi:bacterioferritin